MESSEYERLINRGFRIYKQDKGKIYIKLKKAGWAVVCNYSEERWTEIKNHPKTIVDYGK